MLPIVLTVNGIRHEAEVEPRTLLVDFIRDDLGLTGTKIACDTSPILEKAWHAAAGTGWIGRNACLIAAWQSSYPSTNRRVRTHIPAQPMPGYEYGP